MLDLALECCQRGRMHELFRSASRGGDRKRSKCPCIAPAAEVKIAVENDPAADEITEIEIGEIGEVPSAAKQQLCGTGGGGIVAEVDRPWKQPGDFGLEVEIPPRHQNLMRRPCLLGPVPQLKGGGDPDPHDPLELAIRQSACEFFDARRKKADDLRWRRKGIGPVDGVPDMSGKVEQHQVARSSANFQAD